MYLSPEDFYAIAAALRIAADQYCIDAASCANEAPRMALQFHAQADKAIKLATCIEEQTQ